MKLTNDEQIHGEKIRGYFFQLKKIISMPTRNIWFYLVRCSNSTIHVATSPAIRRRSSQTCFVTCWQTNILYKLNIANLKFSQPPIEIFRSPIDLIWTICHQVLTKSELIDYNDLAPLFCCIKNKCKGNSIISLQRLNFSLGYPLNNSPKIRANVSH